RSAEDKDKDDGDEFPPLESSILITGSDYAVDFRFRCEFNQKEKAVHYKAWLEQVEPKKKGGPKSLSAVHFIVPDMDELLKKGQGALLDDKVDWVNIMDPENWTTR